MTGEIEVRISRDHLVLCQMAQRCLPELDSMPKQQYMDWLWINEELYSHFVRYARDALARNRRRFSCYMIRERVRWYVDVESRGPGRFKISNNLTPYIARTLILDIPQLENVFNIKGPQ